MAILTADEKLQAETAAEEVIKDTFGSVDALQFPVNLDEVLEKYALVLKKGAFENANISGAFSRDESTIYVSGSESQERQLFTVAHEIGHFKLHEDRKTDILYRKQVWQFGNGEEKVETQANWFAANLLMPKAAVERMWKLTNDIDRMAKFFGISKTAMRFRLKDLGLLR